MIDRISKITLLIVVTELCLGGGGRLFALGPVTLRMILFCLAIVLSTLAILNKKTIQSHYLKILAGFLFVILIGVGVGLLNGSSKELVWEDVRPLLYFLMLPFFILAIDQREIESISGIIKTSSLILAGVFFVVLILIHSRAVPFLTFYKLTESTNEFFYRGQLSFFYKGFLFLGIGSVFFYVEESRKKYIFIGILILAIFLSVTRGLLFSLAVTSLIYFIVNRRYFNVITITVMAVSIVLWGNKGTIKMSQWLDSVKTQRSFTEANPHLFGNRNFSDEGRMMQLKEVSDQISIKSTFIGHGFGQGTLSRPVHMEIAYLEIFHKQGLVGLAFWGTFAWMIFTAYLKSNKTPMAEGYFYSSVFVFAESMTNQYFNNPIGMSVLLLSLVSLDKMKKLP